jgi:hypothetical protein
MRTAWHKASITKPRNNETTKLERHRLWMRLDFLRVSPLSDIFFVFSSFRAFVMGFLLQAHAHQQPAKPFAAHGNARQALSLCSPSLLLRAS